MEAASEAAVLPSTGVTRENPVEDMVTTSSATKQAETSMHDNINQVGKPKMLPRMVKVDVNELDLTKPRFAIGNREIMSALSAEDIEERTTELVESSEMTVSIAKELIALLGAYIPNVNARTLLSSGEYEAMALVYPVKNDQAQTVVGGCAYKPHDDANFIELALFCVDIGCQGHGLGRILMERLERRGIEDLNANVIFAYADTKALPFFKRQNFSRIISTDPAIFRRRIVAYNEARIMEKVLKRPVVDNFSPDETFSQEKECADLVRMVSGTSSSEKTILSPPKKKNIGCTSGLANCYCRSGRTRAIERYDPKTMDTLEIYCSAADAARKLGLANCSVTHVTNGFSQNARGHYFRYVEDLPFLTGSKSVVRVIPIEMSGRTQFESNELCGINNHLFIKEYYSSCREASRHCFGSMSIQNNNIGMCCNGMIDHVQGKIFRWADDRVHPCAICSSDENAAQLLLCDGIDQRCISTAHIYCLKLNKIPDGEWYCPSCEARRAAGIDVHKAVPRGEPRGFFSDITTKKSSTSTKKKQITTTKPQSTPRSSLRKAQSGLIKTPPTIQTNQRLTKRAAAAGVAKAVRATLREGSVSSTDDDQSSCCNEKSSDNQDSDSESEEEAPAQSKRRRFAIQSPAKTPQRKIPLPSRARKSPIKNNKPLPPAKSSLSSIGIKKMKQDNDGDLHQKLTIQQNNPKKPGSQSYERYENYKNAKTVGEFLMLGGTRADLRNDIPRGFIFLESSATRLVHKTIDEFWRPKDTRCLVLFCDNWYLAYVFQYTEKHAILHYVNYKGQASIVDKMNERHLVRWDVTP
uniref:PHD-type domain-containing protein n=1 Tax=Aureoumbra lagunensis TaxID=44058 RepID=A0A7S3NP64_9STRA|mmetsp:Transcript_8490/g.10780  ORF Transcript_8490/g.10780 Transcript_8490/m.10780 type:complete len:809 (+) Transcript_8490:84-2510(+)